MDLSTIVGRGLYAAGMEQQADLLLKVIPNGGSAYEGVCGAFVGDFSFSMTGDVAGTDVGEDHPSSRISLMRQALLQFPKFMGEKDIVSLVGYGDTVRTFFTNKTKRGWPAKEIPGYRLFGGGTQAWLGLKEACNILRAAPAGFYKCIILMSDGEDHDEENAIRNTPTDIPVYTVAIGKSPKATFFGRITEKSGCPLPTVAIREAGDFATAFQTAMGVAREVKCEDVVITLNLATAQGAEAPMLAPSLVYQVAPTTQNVRLTPGAAPNQLKIAIVGGMGGKGVAVYLQGLLTAPMVYKAAEEVTVGSWTADWRTSKPEHADGGNITLKVGEGMGQVEDDVKKAARIANASARMDKARLAAEQGDFGKSKAMLAQAKKVVQGDKSFASVDDMIDQMMAEVEDGTLSAGTFGASKAMTAATAQDLLED